MQQHADPQCGGGDVRDLQPDEPRPLHRLRGGVTDQAGEHDRGEREHERQPPAPGYRQPRGAGGEQQYPDAGQAKLPHRGRGREAMDRREINATKEGLGFDLRHLREEI